MLYRLRFNPMSILKIGILLTDHVLEDLQKKHNDQDNFYRRIFEETDQEVNLEIYDVTQFIYPKSLDECDGYIITGSKLSVYDDERWIRVLEKFIVDLFLNKKLILGVCFGHQLIAKALGGEVKKADIGWVLGVQSYEFKTNYPWLEHMNEDVQLIHSHQDQVMRLPESATLVASNKYVPNSMYYIEDHVMCMQGHPEFTNAYAYDVLCKRRDVLGEEKFKQAESSLLNEKTDYLEVTNWWLEFFKSKNQLQ